MTSGQVLWGLANGVTVMALAGAFWIGVGLAVTFSETPWAIASITALQLSGLAALVVAAHRLRRRSGFTRRDLRRDDPQTRRIVVGFRWAALMEFVLVGSAVWLCRWFDRQDLLWPGIALAISLHFAPLGRMFFMPEYYMVSLLGSMIAVALLPGPPGDWRLPWLGSGMAVLMWGCSVYLLARSDRLAARAVGRTS
jgi:hypothetical protein